MIVALIILVAVLLVTALVTCYFAKKTFSRGGKVYDLDEVLKDTPEQLDFIHDCQKELDRLTSEKHYIKSFDGLKLVGNLYRAEGDSKKFIISMHGYRSSSGDFSGAIGFFMSEGYNVLAVDQRAHGESEGKWITFGIKERYDALSWAKYVIDTFGNDTEIILDGISMGATTVLMAAGLDLPSNVKGIIADCGFTSPFDIVSHVAKKDMHIPKFPLLYLMIPTVRLLCGFNLKAESTLNAIKKSKLPILFVHGLADDFVPHEMSVRAYNARPENSRLYSVENAAHGLSYVVDEKSCQKELHLFFEATERGRF